MPENSRAREGGKRGLESGGVSFERARRIGHSTQKVNPNNGAD